MPDDPYGAVPPTVEGLTWPELKADASGDVNPDAWPVRYSLRGLFLGTAIVAIFLGGLQFAFERSHLRSQSQLLTNNLRQQYLGLLNYESARDMLPPPVRMDDAGQPLYSWRFQVTPYWESQPFNRDFRASWDAPVNSTFASWHYEVFCWNRDRLYETSVFAVTGQGTAFYANYPVSSESLPPQLILIMEKAGSKTHWMQPGDFHVDDLLNASGTLGDSTRGVMADRIHVLFADGKVWPLSPRTPMDAIKPFLRTKSAKSASRDERLKRYRMD